MSVHLLYPLLLRVLLFPTSVLAASGDGCCMTVVLCIFLAVHVVGSAALLINTYFMKRFTSVSFPVPLKLSTGTYIGSLLVCGEPRVTLQHFGAYAHTFDKAFVELLGMSMGGFRSLLIVWQSFPAMDVKGTHENPINLFCGLWKYLL